MELPTSADLKVKRRLVTELLEHRPVPVQQRDARREDDQAHDQDGPASVAVARRATGTREDGGSSTADSARRFWKTRCTGVARR